MLRWVACFLAVLAIFAGHRPAAAADTTRVAFEPARIDGYIVTVKANAFASPKWQGAGVMSAIAYPTVSFRKVGEAPKFSSPDDGIGFGLLDNKVFTAGPVFRYVGGRYDGSDKDLRGIHDARWTLESGLFADAWITPNLRARAEIRRGFREKDGFAANLGLDLVNSFNSWTVALGPRLAFGDGSYMRNHFGVTARDAALNPRVYKYRAKSGMKSVGIYASATYKFSDTWSATLHGGYDRLVRSAANSPITARLGSTNQYTVGLTLSYSFPMKGFW
ncbi:MAG TPA: MipA/OmpV family protein [Beijerinckiaceae bacterium]|nr:MipA/OmpV family protein [Beijerinckiaceae bacterium]